MKCKYAESCGYEICVPDYCPEYEGAMLTNADRIRAMTDAELVKFIEETQIAGCPDPARSCRASCQDCIMDWLHQPAEVGDG